MYKHFLHPDGATLKHSDYCVPRVELELAFVLKDALEGPDVNMMDVLRATEYVVPSLELIDTRVDEPRKIFDTIADNGAGAGLVLGGRPVRPHDVDLRMVTGVLYRNTDIEETGVSCGVMGHPANGIAWLANKLHEIGEQLHPGQILLAGSFVRRYGRRSVIRFEQTLPNSVRFRFDLNKETRDATTGKSIQSRSRRR